MDFYSIVLTVAIIMFILLLTLMGILISRATQTKVFPPTMGTCPDYWVVDNSGNCVFPKDSINKGFYSNYRKDDLSYNKVPFPVLMNKTDPSSNWFFDPQDSRWASLGKTSICAQRDWSIKQNIVWDGVSNYNGC